MASFTNSPAARSSHEEEKVKEAVGNVPSFHNEDLGEGWVTTKKELYSFYAYYIGNNGLSGFK